jgi:hypothetical protein
MAVATDLSLVNEFRNALEKARCRFFWRRRGNVGSTPQGHSSVGDRLGDPNRSFVAGADIGRPRSKADDQVFSRDAQRFMVVRQVRRSISCHRGGAKPARRTDRAETRVSAAEIASPRSRTLGQPPDKRPHRLRSLAACLRNGHIGGKGYPEALRLLAQAIERDPRYGPCTGLGRLLPFSALRGRLERRSGGG